MDKERDARRAAIARFAKSLERISDPPTSASDWAARFSSPEHTAYHVAVDAEVPCRNCGGRDGVIVSVLSCAQVPTIHNKIVITAFNHHEGSSVGLATLDIEAAKQIVNRLGEAIAVAERVAREGAPR